VLANGNTTGDKLPASYHYYEAHGKKKSRVVADPAEGVKSFLKRELSLGDLGEMLRHLWFAGAKHRATQLHFQVAMGREIVVADRMDLHLLWDNGKIFLKPIPRYLLDSDFWQLNLKCLDTCTCQNPGGAPPAANPGQLPGNQEQPPVNHEQPPVNPGLLPANQEPPPCMDAPRKIALGFLYTYACLISSESDFFVANEKRLLPRDTEDSTIKWENWKKLVRELVKNYDPNKIHPRFLRAELRLSRINNISRFTRLPPFDPYLRGWRNYSSLFRDNLAWMAAATVFIALVLTAMQLGLATDRLKDNRSFQRASYGFTVFSILGPMCAFGLVALGALFNLVKDLPWLIGGEKAPAQVAPQDNPEQNQNPPANQGAGQVGDGAMV
jgi:hypothetical protein